MNPATRRRMRRRTLENNDPRGKPWASLPPHLLISLLMQLGIFDLYACAGVCKEWRSIMIEYRSTFLQKKQPLALLKSIYTKKACLFYDMCQRKTYKTLPSNLNLQWLVGITCGYLIMLVDSKIWLLNLITRNEIHFPMLPVYKSYHIRAILFYSKELSENLLLVLNKKFPFVVLSRSSEPKWHIVELVGRFGNPVDIAYFNENIHILTSDAKIGTLKLNVTGGTELRSKPNVRFSFVGINIQVSVLFPLHLVPSNDQLYMVSYVKQESGKVIMIHKLEERLMEWERVKHLGNNALFVSKGSCGIVNPTMWGGRSNCIYFISKKHTEYYEYSISTSESLLDAIDIEPEVKGSSSRQQFWYFPHQVYDKNIVP